MQADWIPKLLPQYCHFSGPEQSPAPWYCTLSGKVKCQQQSTFCKTTPYPLTLLPLFDLFLCLVYFTVCICIYSQSWMEASCHWDGSSWRPWAIQTVCQVSAGRTGTWLCESVVVQTQIRKTIGMYGKLNWNQWFVNCLWHAFIWNQHNSTLFDVLFHVFQNTFKFRFLHYF